MSRSLIVTARAALERIKLIRCLRMVLPSYSFIFIFLPITLILYWIATSRNLYTAGKLILLISSLLFYAFLSPGIKGLCALMISAAVSFLIANIGLRRQITISAKIIHDHRSCIKYRFPCLLQIPFLYRAADGICGWSFFYF